VLVFFTTFLFGYSILLCNEKVKGLGWDLMVYEGYNMFSGEYTNTLALVRRPRSWRLELYAAGIDACSGRLRGHKEVRVFSSAEEFFAACDDLMSLVSWSDDDSWCVSDPARAALKYITAEDEDLAAKIERILEEEYGSDDSEDCD
jgi:hypothetical protein